MPSSHLGEPVGYRMALPDGWSRLNVREDVEETIAETLAQVLPDDLPRDDRAKRRAAIEGRLRLGIDAAKKIDAHALYLPLGGMHGFAIPASFVVAEATDFSGGGPTEDVLTHLLDEPGASAVQLHGSDAVRTDSVVAAVDAVTGTDIPPTRQIVYTVPMPNSPRWLIVVYDVLTAGDPNADFVDALVGLFDAVMTTFRWQFAETTG